MERLNDETYMRLAIQMAAATNGQTGINPMVGCVLVKEGKIVGMGAHLRMGSGHAEVNALQQAGSDAEGATAYVTLEPCSHFGRTPPCSDRLIHQKVKRVVVACLDPNPQVSGRGIAKLRNAGIEVTVGVLECEAMELNERFNKFIVTRFPFVTMKTASTFDGKTASRTGDSKWITSEEARSYVHQLRHQHQAIMVGIGTVLADDPLLTTRLPVPGINPIRVIVDSQLRIPETANVLDTSHHVETMILTTALAPEDKRSRLESNGITVIEAGVGPKVDLALAMKCLGEREIGSILLEGGGTLNGAMLEAQLIDKCYLFITPKLIGGRVAGRGSFEWAGRDRMEDAVSLTRMRMKQFGDDFCLIGYPRYERGDADVHRNY